MENKDWGQLLILDLHQCNNDILTSEKKLKEFASKICKEINMKPFGEPLIKKFGEKKLKGYSLMQFIETSSVVIHADQFGDRVFIDIFSCKSFDIKTAAEFSKSFFEAKNARGRNILRN